MISAQVKVNTGSPMVSWDADDSAVVGAGIQASIKQRTGAGIDATGSRFAEYSPAYSKRQRKTKVDLRNTGRMLGTLAMAADDDGASVSVDTEYAQFVDDNRPFMGVTASEAKGVYDEVEELFDDHIADANKGGRGRTPMAFGG